MKKNLLESKQKQSSCLIIASKYFFTPINDTLKFTSKLTIFLITLLKNSVKFDQASMQPHTKRLDKRRTLKRGTELTKHSTCLSGESDQTLTCNVFVHNLFIATERGKFSPNLGRVKSDMGFVQQVNVALPPVGRRAAFTYLQKR